MARYAMVTDLRACVGCHACTVACNAEWDVPAGQARTSVRTTPLVGTFPRLQSSAYIAQCNQCDNPPCVDACPSGATSRTDSGIVRIDRHVCIGCGFCVEACPYDARHIDRQTKKADKCDFCLPRLERGQEPACVTTCTAHAKYFGDLEDRRSAVSAMVFEGDARRMQTTSVAVGPNVYYTGRASQLDLVQETFPPRLPRLPAAGAAWTKAFRPLMLALVGATFAGQAVAFFMQLRNGEKDFED